jgi:DNA-binding NarL/FixJ family response regulator
VSGKARFSLTEREVDVLRLIADGLTNEQIADALYISTGTVRTHIANIFGKLNARTRTEAARIALRNELI